MLTVSKRCSALRSGPWRSPSLDRAWPRGRVTTPAGGRGAASPACRLCWAAPTHTCTACPTLPSPPCFPSPLCVPSTKSLSRRSSCRALWICPGLTMVVRPARVLLLHQWCITLQSHAVLRWPQRSRSASRSLLASSKSLQGPGQSHPVQPGRQQDPFHSQKAEQKYSS